MFLFNGVIFLTNIFLINYNFIELYEYFIIHLAIPHINYIYNLRGQNKVIDIIIYDNFNKIVVNGKYSDSEENSDSDHINHKYQNHFPDESDSDIDINIKNNKFKYNNDYTKQKYNNQFLCENESDISSEIIIVDK
jgi:hypothetical protein